MIRSWLHSCMHSFVTSVLWQAMATRDDDAERSAASLKVSPAAPPPPPPPPPRTATRQHGRTAAARCVAQGRGALSPLHRTAHGAGAARRAVQSHQEAGGLGAGGYLKN